MKTTKLKKAIAVLLGSVVALSTAACNKDKVDYNATPDNVVHQVAGTLHKVNVTDRNVPFVTNGQTEYKIYVDTSDPKLSSAINKSAGFVSEQVFNATGAQLEVWTEKPQGLTSSSDAIVYGYKDVFASFGLTMPTDDLGSTGYYVKTVGNVVFIQAYGGDGYRMGGLAFLRAVLGYDMISETCVVYDKNGATMPNMDIVERPDFDYRQIQNYYTSQEVYGMGMHTHSDIWIPVNGWDMHNSLYFIPPTEFADEHPEWYREDLAQPCYTAHGDPVEYKLMLEQVAKVIKQRMAECPTLENISFTAMDGTGQDTCACEMCSEFKMLYGTPAASCIYFMNDLNKIIQEHIANTEPGRVMNLTFFAYHDAEPAPVERVKYTDTNGNVIWTDPIKDEDGNYIPLKCYARGDDGQFIKDENGNYEYDTDDEGNCVYLKCDDNVSPWLAPIYSKFTSSFYEDRNKTYAQNVSLWYTVSKNVYVWIYGTNFSYYLYPYNTWSVVTETYRYMRECGVKYIWTQGQERNQATAFTDLKDYIDSKFQFDVNADLSKVLDDYFNNYYLEASVPMRTLFHLIQAHSAELEKTQPTISGGIYDDIDNAEYWPKQLLEEMLRYIDQAYAAVEKYKAADPKLYANLVRRIKQESIFPRYAQCMYFEYPDLQQKRESFRNDWNELGFSVYKEWDGNMQPIFTQWGLN